MTEAAKELIILVPVDFSPSSESAMEYASALATCMHANLVVLHVVHEPFDTPGYYRKKGAADDLPGWKMWRSKCSMSFGLLSCW